MTKAQIEISASRYFCMMTNSLLHKSAFWKIMENGAFALHAQIQEFLSVGGGGGPGQSDKKNL